ncbi:MAG: DUF1800 family protein [Dokdonella sp.]|uniref:DUF1800 domain-containing protein n=1 Tax=Dokdonella sp. TaxID=2291710 RepID=UPI0032648313
MSAVFGRCAIAFALASGASVACAGDHVFDSGFDDASEGPHSDAQSARFLTQSTFGATLPEITRLRDLGYRAWLDEQYALPASHHRPYLEAQAAAGLNVYQNSRQEAWWLNAVNAPDQLRQRVAFALSELFVVSDRNGSIENEPIAMANYQDVLVDGALGNYRTLLANVTLNPVMGHYLSMFKNRKSDATQNIRPDENYAREIMQLFSVGLVQLAPDGTPLLSNGQPIPTYDQDTIRGFANVFTGWNWHACPRPQGGQPWEWEYCPVGDFGWLLPMDSWESFHASDDNKQLTVYPGVALAGGVLPGGETAQGDLDAALDNLFNHPNVPAFVARHLIKRLVTGNPSAAFVGRVAAVFANNGLGVRGDLDATVRAMLLDPEARALPTLASNAGKLSEPLLRLSRLWRVFSARADDGRYREWNPEGYLGQAPLRAPTVFNFFLPDYQPPGELSSLGLDAPEFQITTDTTIASTANGLGAKVYYFWRGSDSQGPEDIVVDLAPEVALAGDAVQLVDRFDLLFMNRTMSSFMFDTLVAYVQGMPSGSDAERRQRVQDAVWLIQTSPEYVIER